MAEFPLAWPRSDAKYLRLIPDKSINRQVPDRFYTTDARCATNGHISYGTYCNIQYSMKAFENNYSDDQQIFDII